MMETGEGLLHPQWLGWEVRREGGLVDKWACGERAAWRREAFGWELRKRFQ